MWSLQIHRADCIYNQITELGMINNLAREFGKDQFELSRVRIFQAVSGGE